MSFACAKSTPVRLRSFCFAGGPAPRARSSSKRYTDDYRLIRNSDKTRRNRLKTKSPIYLSFLVLAACATSKREVPSDEERILRYKNEFPGFELCLCNEPDLSTNLVTSRLYWQMKEKSICKNPNENIIRIIYSEARREDQVYRLSKKDSVYYLTRKYLKWNDVRDMKGGFTLNETEVKLSVADSDSIYRVINGFKAIERGNTIWVDCSVWQIEAMVNGTYSWFWIYGGRTELDRNFKRFLQDEFRPDIDPR